MSTTAATVTRLLKSATDRRWTTERTSPYTFRAVLVTDADLTEADRTAGRLARAAVVQADDLEGTWAVTQPRRRTSRSQVVVTVVDTAERTRREDAQAEAREVAIARALAEITPATAEPAPATPLELAALTVAEVAPATVLEAARLAGLYSVVTGETAATQQVVGSYESGERADEVAEIERGHGVGASVIRPCGHAWDRYARVDDCPECSSIASLRSVVLIGGHLNPLGRATIARADADDARMTALREVPVGDGLVHLMSDDLLDACGTAGPGGLELAPSSTPEQITCPACAALATEEPDALDDLPELELDRTAREELQLEALAQGRLVDDVSARSVLDTGTPASIPGEAAIAGAHAAVEQAPRVAEVLTVPATRTAPQLLDAVPVGDTHPVAELQELALRRDPHLSAPGVSRAARHVAAVLRGAARGALLITGYDADGDPVVRYTERRGDRPVSHEASAAVLELTDAGYLRHDAGNLRVTRRGRALLDALPTLSPRQ